MNDKNGGAALHRHPYTIYIDLLLLDAYINAAVCRYLNEWKKMEPAEPRAIGWAIANKNNNSLAE